MNYDLSQIVTKGFKFCQACQYEARTQDKFCRRCGSKLNGPQSGDTTGSRATQSIESVSGALVATVITRVTTRTGQIHSLPARCLLSALISFPIWLIIILLSPLEAYLSARSVAREAWTPAQIQEKELFDIPMQGQ